MKKTFFFLTLIIQLIQSVTWEEYYGCSIECEIDLYSYYGDADKKDAMEMDASYSDHMACRSGNQGCRFIFNLSEDEKQGNIHKDYVQEYKRCFEDCDGKIKHEVVYDFFVCDQHCFGNNTDYKYSEPLGTGYIILIIVIILVVLALGYLGYRRFSSYQKKKRLEADEARQNQLDQRDADRQLQQQQTGMSPQRYITQNINKNNKNSIKKEDDIAFNQVEIADQQNNVPQADNLILQGSPMSGNQTSKPLQFSQNPYGNQQIHMAQGIPMGNQQNDEQVQEVSPQQDQVFISKDEYKEFQQFQKQKESYEKKEKEIQNDQQNQDQGEGIQNVQDIQIDLQQQELQQQEDQNNEDNENE